MKPRSEDDIRRAEYQKIVAEAGKAKAEKDKLELEKRELEKKILAPFYKRQWFWQAIATAVASVPLIWFYYEKVEEPRLENIKYENQRLQNAIDSSLEKLKQDSIYVRAKEQENDSIAKELQSARLTIIDISQKSANFRNLSKKQIEELTIQLNELKSNNPFLPDVRSTAKKRPISQEEFHRIVERTPKSETIIIEDREGQLTIGDYEGYKLPRDRNFEFIGCKFGTLLFMLTSQNQITLTRCNISSVFLTTDASLNHIILDRTRVKTMTTIDGSSCEYVEVKNGFIETVINDSGNAGFTFRNIVYNTSVKN